LNDGRAVVNSGGHGLYEVLFEGPSPMAGVDFAAIFIGVSITIA
jgi:hypothetical protein